MDAKNVIGVFLVIAGIAALIPGVLGAFEGYQIMGFSPWAWVVIGGIMFAAGISLMRSIRSPQTTTTVNKLD
jgi:hypothetical protein